MCGFRTFLLSYDEVLQKPVVTSSSHPLLNFINYLLLTKQLNKDVKYVLTKLTIKLPHHGFACDHMMVESLMKVPT